MTSNREPTPNLPGPRPGPDATVVVITDPAAEIRLSHDGVRSLGGADVRDFGDAIADRAVTCRPLFGASEARLAALAGRQQPEVGIDVPDLSVFYRVTAPPERLQELADRLLEQDFVTAAYVKPRAAVPVRRDLMRAARLESPPDVTPDFSARQGYLDPAPGGVNARYAWTVDGGTGTSVRIFDIELGGWQFTHEDLRQNQGGAVGEAGVQVMNDRSHATAVVGELGGDANNRGIIGICPGAHVRGAYVRVNGSAAAIRAATDLLGKGDILVVEAHRPGPTTGFALNDDQFGYIPVEWWEDDFRAIRYAIAHGVIVVAAAGNGGVNLDAPVFDTPGPGFPSTWRNPFDRASRDSGSVLVGAGAPPSGNFGPDRSRLEFSNYGSAVDAQGWGAEVTTTGYGDLQGGLSEDEWYTDTFAGTSSATPIVAGALACVQGRLSAHLFDERLTPSGARALLRSTGSPQTDAPGRPASQRIGNRPSLGQMLPGPVLYAVTHREVTLDGPIGGEVLWYRHLGRRDGSAAWEGDARRIAGGWHRQRPFTGGPQIVYAVQENGDLLWRRHLGAGDGDPRWSPAVRIGNGWSFTHVFSAGSGYIYAVRPFGLDPDTGRQLGGDLLLYQHLGWSDGTPRWAGEPKLVGTKWHFQHIVAGNDAAIYAITRDGEVYHYVHQGRGVGSRDWSPRTHVASGWVYEHVVYAGEGVIYTVDAEGVLWWHRHDGYRDGTDRWAPRQPIGHGWNFKTVLAG